jgi:hypothetical protein
MIYYFGLRVMRVSLATGTAVMFEIKMFSFSLNALALGEKDSFWREWNFQLLTHSFLKQLSCRSASDWELVCSLNKLFPLTNTLPYELVCWSRTLFSKILELALKELLIWRQAQKAARFCCLCVCSGSLLTLSVLSVGYSALSEPVTSRLLF